MRNAAAHASTLQTYGDVLALQQMQLGSIHNDISDGNTRLCDQLEDLKTHRNVSKGSQVSSELQTVTRASNKHYFSGRNRSSMRFRLPLMAWLASRTWEIAVSESNALWTWRVNPINYRPADSPVFDYVRGGNIAAVAKLLHARELSIWDVTRNTTLLGVRMAASELRGLG
jgi:hypothetical protein